MFGKNAYRDANMKTVDEASLIPLLVASIKEQQQQIEELKAAVAELKKNHKHYVISFNAVKAQVVTCAFYMPTAYFYRFSN